METTERFPHGLGNLAQNARFPHSHKPSSLVWREEKKTTTSIYQLTVSVATSVVAGFEVSISGRFSSVHRGCEVSQWRPGDPADDSGHRDHDDGNRALHLRRRIAQITATAPDRVPTANAVSLSPVPPTTWSLMMGTIRIQKPARILMAGKYVCQDYAATTLIRPAFRERGFRRITISTSWSSAVNRFIRRSTEKPASL